MQSVEEEKMKWFRSARPASLLLEKKKERRRRRRVRD
jgi:hypothetical protein